MDIIATTKVKVYHSLEVDHFTNHLINETS